MEFKIEHCDHGYFLKIGNYGIDYNVAFRLNIPYQKYLDILIQHHTYQAGYKNECFFKNEEDVKELIEFLESYLILEKLTK